MNKKLLLIDFNKTLQDRAMWQSLKDEDNPLYSNFEKVDDYVFKENRAMLEAWLTGAINTEDVHKEISEKLNLDYRYLLDSFIYDCEHMLVEDEHLVALQDLQDEYYLILVTDNMDSFDRFTLPQNPYLKVVFDEIHNSYNLRSRKHTNKGEYFQRILYKYNISAKHTLLIDDSQKSCDIAKSYGIKTFRPETIIETLEYLKKLSK